MLFVGHLIINSFERISRLQILLLQYQIFTDGLPVLNEVEFSISFQNEFDLARPRNIVQPYNTTFFLFCVFNMLYIIRH